MKYDFDKQIDRRGTGSVKYDFLAENGFAPDAIPLWVADMDLRAPREVTEKLEAVARHGIFGYSDAKASYFEAVHDWFAARHGWAIRPEWLVKAPGVVFAIAAAVRAFSDEGDGVIIQRPVYYPFEKIIRANGRRVVDNALILRSGRYEMDFDGLEQLLSGERVKIFLLCSPHNPVGRVWTAAELTRVGELCRAHGVLVISDEIHCDFTYPGITHIPFASLGPDFSQNSVICTAPSKTFNLAGVQAANIFVPDGAKRKRLVKSIGATGFAGLSAFGLAACETAYRFGGDWLQQLRPYLYDNLCFVRDFLREHLPQVRLIEPEGTYLLWLDFSACGLSDAALEDLLRKKAGLWLDEGCLFGPQGQGFQRVNIACPRSLLQKALERLAAALA